MQKTTILPVCLGILLAGILVIQPVFAENIITNQNFLSITEDPDAYKGVWVKVSGQIERVQYWEDEGIYGYTFHVGGQGDGIMASDQSLLWFQNEKGGVVFAE